ncbi:helix-turn-helix domain-containing protein [Verrucomicrobia bacterium]|nr:helix-turn-helix domain-containing protein [Verrucomicrobiota bacterium]
MTLSRDLYKHALGGVTRIMVGSLTGEISIAKREDRHVMWIRLACPAKYDPMKLSKQVGLSLRQLQRYFAKDFGMPPREWLKEKRAVDARTLLKEKMSLKCIACVLGYEHQSQFTRDFKASYGLTPKDFRKKYVVPFSVEEKLGLKKPAFKPSKGFM